jgi:hypothetical protein
VVRRALAVGWAAIVLGGVGACGGDDSGDGRSAAASSSTSRTVEDLTTSSSPPSTTTSTTAEPTTPEEEVEAAYLKSWDVYAEAVRELDPSRLEEAYAKESLETVRREVERRTRERDPIKVIVEHQYVVELLGSSRALVIDRYTDSSVPLDPVTGEARATPEPEVLDETYTLEKLGDSWKVVLIQRET